MVTIKDVARRANVSFTTVSHVVNKTRPVSRDTAERVNEAISALGYLPSELARSLKSSRTRTIGMIVTTTSNPFFGEVIRGVERACFEAGYALDDLQHRRRRAAPRRLYAHAVCQARRRGRGDDLQRQPGILPPPRPDQARAGRGDRRAGRHRRLGLFRRFRPRRPHRRRLPARSRLLPHRLRLRPGRSSAHDRPAQGLWRHARRARPEPRSGHGFAQRGHHGGRAGRRPAIAQRSRLERGPTRSSRCATCWRSACCTAPTSSASTSPATSR